MTSIKKDPSQEKSAAINACPHCGRPLSAWEKVLLKVDHALMCKGCWYRILLNPFDDQLFFDEPKKNG